MPTTSRPQGTHRKPVSLLPIPVVLLLCLLAALLTSFANCGGQAGPHDGDATPTAQPTEQATPTARPDSAFDERRAWQILTAQTDFGPRNPGSDGHSRCKEWLLEQMGQATDRAELQTFTHTSTHMAPGQTFEMANVVGVIEGSQGAGARRVLLCAHWDTRPVADRDPDPNNRQQPILGANDGASGVAVCLEIARALKAQRAPTEVVLVLFDGEDFGVQTGQEWFLGSTYFASHMGDYRPSRGILVDMIGDAELRVEWEENSLLADQALMDIIWNRAGALGHRQAFPTSSQPTARVSDDHIPLNQAGVPTVDLIDFNYRYWHTIEDTPDKCSQESLKAVGETVLAVVRDGI